MNNLLERGGGRRGGVQHDPASQKVVSPVHVQQSHEPQVSRYRSFR